MADIDNDIVSQLIKKIDDQARFTRIVTALCCLTIIGCMSYAISSMVYIMPDLVIAKVMNSMEGLYSEWKTINIVETHKAK